MPDLKNLYLEQLKKALMNTLNHEVPENIINPASPMDLMQPGWFDHYWSGKALTMCSLKRLNNIQECVEDCLERGVPGDLIECGTWRGGSTILMRGILAAHGVTDRKVWVADSFQGLPKPPDASVDNIMYNVPQVVAIERFAVDLEVVKKNFARYGLLDDQVEFVPGWFHETLPSAPVEEIAVLRLDGDFYESTIDTLNNLYSKVSPGGYIIIDDWGIEQVCGEKAAVLDFRKAHGITDEIMPVDWHSAYWQKGG